VAHIFIQFHFLHLELGSLLSLISVKLHSDSEIEDIISTNLHGCIRVLKGALPTLRKQRSGTVITMGSILGFAPIPGAALYSCTKFALDGLAECLAAELADFGVRVLTLMPGMFRTDVLKKSRMPAQTPIRDYAEGVMARVNELATAMVVSADTMIQGDPEQLGRRVVELVERRAHGQGLDGVLRVPMGSDAVTMIKSKMQKLHQDFALTANLATSTNYEGLADCQPLAEAQRL
jgi:NAD(P)-dependent dehydrogenase (short-subunit alcohol dehydrogenase family)